jgi:dipeptidyl aminopeptidase/acylaminoacyl peptidase
MIRFAAPSRRPSSFPAILAGLATATALVLSAGPDPLAAQEPFSFDDVLSAPFPDGLVAAREVDALAWIVNDRGERNVWVAEGPDFEGRAVTAHRGDDGQEISGLAIDPHARWVVYVRGGAPNRDGWVPTPAHDVDGAERALWLARLDGGAPVKLADAGSAVLSPDGDRIAFTLGGTIRVKPLPDGEATEVARPRGGAGSLRWSPDGDRIAFVSSRGGHAFIGVVQLGDSADADARGIRYLDPSVDRDSRPVWSPDGRRLAFVREPVTDDRLPFFARREDSPWSVRVVDLESDRASEAFRADPGQGSAFYGVASDDQLMWAAGDLLVFPWEKDGWLRLWAVPAAGGEPRLLTPGEHEVQRVALSPDGARVLFDSNRDDIDRRHAWVVEPAGGAPRLLTPGEGLEWGPVETGGGHVAFLGSGARAPARPFVLGDGGERLTPAGDVPAEFPADRLVTPSAITFPATDGLTIHGQLFLPPDLREGERRPALLFFHGGSRRQMLLGFHHRGYYHNAYAFNQAMAARGYVVLAVNYRSGIGYGLDFREAEEYGAEGASEVRDVLGAALYLVGRDDVDADRIALWGGSYGGYLTAQGLVHAPELFAAGVDVHGVHDWNVGIGNFVPSYEPENVPETAELALRSSPVALLDRWEDPVLLIHGDDDRNVRFSETADLVRELRRRDVHVEQLVLPDEVHGFLLHRSWLEVYRTAADFLDRHLRGGG